MSIWYNEQTDTITMPFGAVTQPVHGKIITSRVRVLFFKGESA